MREAAHALLETSQRRLEHLYGLMQAPSPLTFLTHQPHSHTDSEEALLVQHDRENDELALALYVSSDLLQRLQAGSAAGLHDIATAIEGVSHLRCVLFKADRNRPTSGLELELQAEVDKFLLLTGLGLRSPELREHLFQRHRLHATLCASLRERYQESTRLAARYCRFLERRFLGCNALEKLLAELRRFYRMDQQQKITHITRMQPI